MPKKPSEATPASRAAARHSAAPRRSGKPVDLRSPFVFNLRELGRRPGNLREYRRTLPAPAGLGLEVIGVPEGASLTLEARLESVTEGVLVSGSVTAPLAGQCARCLDPIADDIAVEIVELFAYPDSTTDETSDADEIVRCDGETVDVEPVVHDALVLALPWTPLCRDDCAGLCPDCGQRLDDLPPDHAHEKIDPRWAALGALAGSSAAPPARAAPGDSTAADQQR